MRHTVMVLAQDRPALLNRVVSLFRRRGVRMESLILRRTDQADISQLTMVVEADHLALIVRELHTLIEVLDVCEITQDPSPPPIGHVSEMFPASVHPQSQADGIP